MKHFVTNFNEAYGPNFYLLICFNNIMKQSTLVTNFHIDPIILIQIRRLFSVLFGCIASDGREKKKVLFFHFSMLSNEKDFIFLKENIDQIFFFVFYFLKVMSITK